MDKFLPVGFMIRTLEWCMEVEDGEFITTAYENEYRIKLGVLTDYQLSLIASMVNLILTLGDFTIRVHPQMVGKCACIYRDIGD